MERTGNGQQGKILTRAWGGPLGKATTAVGLYGHVKSIKLPPKCVCLCPQNSVALRFGPRNYFFQCSVVVTTDSYGQNEDSKRRAVSPKWDMSTPPSRLREHYGKGDRRTIRSGGKAEVLWSPVFQV